MSPLEAPTILEIPCRIGQRSIRFRVYIGKPAAGFGPCHFQLEWLRQRYDGEISEGSPEARSESAPSSAVGKRTHDQPVQDGGDS